jgi:hypothetical protein
MPIARMLRSITSAMRRERRSAWVEIFSSSGEPSGISRQPSPLRST